MRNKLDADAIITALEPRALHCVDLFDNACPNFASAAAVSSRGRQFSVGGYGKHDQYKGQVLFLVSRKTPNSDAAWILVFLFFPRITFLTQLICSLLSPISE